MSQGAKAAEAPCAAGPKLSEQPAQEETPPSVTRGWRRHIREAAAKPAERQAACRCGPSGRRTAVRAIDGRSSEGALAQRSAKRAPERPAKPGRVSVEISRYDVMAQFARGRGVQTPA